MSECEKRFLVFLTRQLVIKTFAPTVLLLIAANDWLTHYDGVCSVPTQRQQQMLTKKRLNWYLWLFFVINTSLQTWSYQLMVLNYYFEVLSLHYWVLHFEKFNLQATHSYLIIKIYFWITQQQASKRKIFWQFCTGLVVDRWKAQFTCSFDKQTVFYSK